MSLNKIPVGILGATGSVGQKFVELLFNHPLFELKELGASERSAGKKYKDVVNWLMSSQLPEKTGMLYIKECSSDFQSKVLFSALDSNVAGNIELELANRGHIIISNAKNHRWDSDVPLIIPEVNPGHLDLLKYQKFNNGGLIVTNPNCSTIGMVLSLKPLYDRFGIEEINVVTMQAISGAGYPGISALDMIDNVVPFISGEEEKLETEPNKIFGKLNFNKIEIAKINISAQTNRVFVKDGHVETVQIRFKNKPEMEQILEAWNDFKALPQELSLPSAPLKPVHYLEDERYPQPRLHRDIEFGRSAITGRLRKCNIFDFKYVVLSNNVIRGAAGGTILIAELLNSLGYLNE